MARLRSNSLKAMTEGYKLGLERPVPGYCESVSASAFATPRLYSFGILLVSA